MNSMTRYLSGRPTPDTGPRSLVISDPSGKYYRWLRNILAVLVYVFLLTPSVIVIPISFGGPGDITFPPREWSLDLYRQFFTSAAWMGPLLQSLKVACSVMIIALAIGVPAAYGAVRFEFPGKRLVILLLMSPILVPVIVVSLGLYLYFSRLGIVGTTWTLVISHVAYVTPFLMITVMAGVKKLDPNLEFAAVIMGAKRGTVFFKVVLPQIIPSIAAGALFAFLISFDEVVIAWFLTAANTTTLPVRMYSSIQWEISPVIAAVSALMTLLSFVFCCLFIWLQPSGNAPEG